MSRQEIAQASYATGVAGLLAATLLLAELASAAAHPDGPGGIHEPAPQAIHRGSI